MKKKQLLFKADLQYKPEMKPVELTDISRRTGELLGSGDGAIEGKKVKGTAHWSIFEVTGQICETNIVGVITTDDGAKIDFETRGYGLVPDSSHPDIWYMPAVLSFKADQVQYEWLNWVLAFWEGMFDVSKGKHNYYAYYEPTR